MQRGTWHAFLSAEIELEKRVVVPDGNCRQEQHLSSDRTIAAGPADYSAVNPAKMASSTFPGHSVRLRSKAVE